MNACKWARFFGFLAVALGLSALGFSDSTLANKGSGDIKATVVKVEGKGLSQLRRKSGATSTVGLGQELGVGDKITTDKDSMIDILLSDGTLVKIGTNSEYKFLGAQPKSGFLYHAFELLRGSVRAMVEKHPDKKNIKFRINTPAGTMGVRGTEIVLNHQKTGEKTSLYLLEGTAIFGNPNCEKEKICIEVNAGEWATISKGQKKPSPVEKFDAEDLFGGSGDDAKKSAAEGLAENGGKIGSDSSSAEGNDGKSKSENKDGTKSDEVAKLLEQQEKEAMLKLLGLAKSSKIGEQISEKDLMALLGEASNLMRDAQNKLLRRDEKLRVAMEQAIANGTFDQYMKLANRFDDLQSKVKKNRTNQDFSPIERAKKFELASAILSTGKVQLVSPKNPGSTDAIKKAYATDGKASIMTSSDISISKEKSISAIGGESFSGKLTEAESVSKQLQTVTLSQTPTTTAETQPAKTATDGADVEAQLTDQLVKELAKDEVISTKLKEYYEYYTYYQKCERWQLLCGDEYYNGAWYDKDTAKSTMTETRTVSRTSGVCYETRKVCGKVMKPCDLSQGKFCEPTWSYECKEEKKVVNCP